MCNPMLAIAAAQATFSFVQQSQSARAQEAAIRAGAEASHAAVGRQYQQVQEQTAQDVSERAKEAMIERARLRVFSGESGLSGGSADRLQTMSRMNEGTDMATIEQNRRNTQEQLFEEAKAGNAQARSRLNSIQQPSLIGAGLQIAGAYYKDKAETERIKSIGRTKP